MGGIERQSSRQALRLTAVVWGFGYLLVAITMAMQAKGDFPLMLASQVPLYLVGVCIALGVRRVYLASAVLPHPSRLAVLALLIPAAAALITAIDLNYHRTLGRTVLPGWGEWTDNFGFQRVMTVMLLYTWTVCLNMTLFWATNVTERAQARADAAEDATHRAQAAMLRLQLNPHFLFNTLNAITSLVASRRNAQAQEMIGQLADFLRAALAADPEAEVPLADEIATVNAYLGIEAVRFGDRIKVEIDAPPELRDALVPNFILQPLVENAVKHGVARSGAETVLSVAAAQRDGALSVEVANQTRPAGRRFEPPRRTSAEERSGLGLNNVRRRLAVLYGDEGRLETAATPDGYSAEVRLPLKRA